jgi:phage shock protein E
MKNHIFALVVAVAAVGVGGCVADAPASAAPRSSSSPASARPALTAELLKRAVVVDVRSAGEHASGHLQGDHNIPVDEVEQRLAEFDALTKGDKNAPIVVYCASGRRSARSKGLLEKAGYTSVIDAGGYSSVADRFPELRAQQDPVSGNITKH